MNPKLHCLCTIRRTSQRWRVFVNLKTREAKFGRCETVTKACSRPLFDDHEREAGVCQPCSKGWSTKRSRFENVKEKARALAAARQKMREWLFCESLGKGFCLYDSRCGRDRCIKHGAILSPAPSVRGLSRKEARKKIEGHQIIEHKDYWFSSDHPDLDRFA